MWGEKAGDLNHDLFSVLVVYSSSSSSGSFGHRPLHPPLRGPPPGFRRGLHAVPQRRRELHYLPAAPELPVAGHHRRGRERRCGERELDPPVPQAPRRRRRAPPQPAPLVHLARARGRPQSPRSRLAGLAPSDEEVPEVVCPRCPTREAAVRGVVPVSQDGVAADDLHHAEVEELPNQVEE